MKICVVCYFHSLFSSASFRLVCWGSLRFGRRVLSLVRIVRKSPNRVTCAKMDQMWFIEGCVHQMPSHCHSEVLWFYFFAFSSSFRFLLKSILLERRRWWWRTKPGAMTSIEIMKNAFRRAKNKEVCVSYSNFRLLMYTRRMYAGARGSVLKNWQRTHWILNTNGEHFEKKNIRINSKQQLLAQTVSNARCCHVLDANGNW